MHVGLVPIWPGFVRLKPGIVPTLPIDDEPGIGDPTLPIIDDPGIDPTLPIIDDPGIDPTLPIDDEPGNVDPTLPMTDDPVSGAVPNMLPGVPKEPGAELNAPPPNGDRPKPELGPNVPIVPKGAAKLRGAAASSAAATRDKM